MKEEEKEIVEAEEQQLSPVESQVEEETPYEDEYADWNADVSKWMSINASELSMIQERVGLLVSAFDDVESFTESAKFLETKNDLAITFLDYVPQVVEGKVDWKTELANWKEINDAELIIWENKIRSLMQAHDFADDFLAGIERFRPKNDISKSMVEFLVIYIEKGLELTKSE